MPVCEVEALTFGYILVLSTPCLDLREVAVSLTEGWVLSKSFQDPPTRDCCLDSVLRSGLPFPRYYGKPALLLPLIHLICWANAILSFESYSLPLLCIGPKEEESRKHSVKCESENLLSLGDEFVVKVLHNWIIKLAEKTAFPVMYHPFPRFPAASV